MTFEQNTEDLAHHEHEIAAHDTFNYAALDSEGPRCSVASKTTRPSAAVAVRSAILAVRPVLR
jgi:hypothetical protein